MLKKASIILISLLAVTNIAFAEYIDATNIPEKKQTKAGLYLDSKDTYNLMQKEGSNNNRFR